MGSVFADDVSGPADGYTDCSDEDAITQPLTQKPKQSHPEKEPLLSGHSDNKSSPVRSQTPMGARWTYQDPPLSEMTRDLANFVDNFLSNNNNNENQFFNVPCQQDQQRPPQEEELQLHRLQPVVRLHYLDGHLQSVFSFSSLFFTKQTWCTFHIVHDLN